MITEKKYADHDEWLAIRSKFIGGSDASAVIGLNPYKSAYELWAEKTGRIPPFEGNTTTKVGAYLEDLVAQMFTEETGKKVRKRNATIFNDEYPWACANIDRAVVGEKAFLEIKTTNSFPIMKTLRSSEEFPEIYYAQCVHYLAVTGMEKAYLAVLINCRELKIYELDRDEMEIAALMNAEAGFWSLMCSDTPPLVDGSESASETLSALYPESDGSKVDLFAMDDILDAYMDVNAKIKDLSGLRDRMANQVKEYMKTAEKGESDRYRVSYGNTERRSFDSKAFEKDNKDLDLSAYWKTTSSRMFRVTAKGDKS